MTPKRVLILAVSLAAALFAAHLTFAPEAEAARLGGGRSFGGSSTYSRPAPAPRTMQPAPGQQSFSNRQNPAAAAPMGAPRSGFGGMMGGLLAGSLLGALFFGGPYSGFGMTDMLLFAVVAFAGLKIFQMMRNRHAPANASAPSRGQAPPPAQAPGNAGNDPWQRMRSDNASDQRSGGFATPPVNRYGDDAPQDGGSVPQGPAEGTLPPGFDQNEFLRGAKMAYTRLQEAWDKRDVDDIARFATPAIVNEVREQAKADPNPSRTDILLINADLVSVTREGSNEVASVFFDVLLRENPKAEAPTQIREIWHFVRPADSAESWKLDGIQQVEG